MGRRRKSKEVAIFESITGLTAIFLFLCFFSPGFRQLLLLIGVLAGVGLVLILLVRLACKAIQPELQSPTFRTFSQTPGQTEVANRYKPPTIAEEFQTDQFVPEPTISEKLRKIDWYQFEKLIGLIYEHRGFSVSRLGGANPDGGVDLILESPDEKIVVQCKHWRKWTVGVRHIREFLGTLTDSQISKGIFITLVGYSDDAKQLA